MRPHSTTLCGRCRFLSFLLWDKQSQGAGRFPRVPFTAALHIVSRNPTTKNDMEVHIVTIINLRDFYEGIDRVLRLQHPVILFRFLIA